LHSLYADSPRKDGEIMGCIYRRNQTYWIKYYRRGKQFAESTHSDKLEIAKRMLKTREGEIADGKRPGICFDRISFDDLLKDYVTDYKINGKKTVKKAERCVSYLLQELEGMMAPEITTDVIKKYVEKRLSSGLNNATVNRELSALKRAFNLAARCTPPKVSMVPYIPMLKENNVRKGFIEHKEYLALKDALPDYLKPVLSFGYFTGWRKAEILNLKWNQVNLREGIVRLEPGETKNSEGRTIYMEPVLWEVVKQLHKNRRMDCFYVFTRNGEKISDFRKEWESACTAASKPELLFHDLRRSAIRNMVRAGVPERVAMMISGHKTRSVFDRYNIVSQDDLKEAAIKRQQFAEKQAEQLQNSYNPSKNGKRLVTLNVTNP
jgi:integrase